MSDGRDTTMDLNRQAVLVGALAVLSPATLAHLLRPGQLASTIRQHRLLPGVRRRTSLSNLYAGLVVALELAVVGLSLTALFGSSARPAGVALVGSGLAFVLYVSWLRRRGYQGECGCSPLTTEVTWLSVVPGGALVAAGAVLVPDRAFDGSALAETSGALQTTLALAAAAILGALLALLPATALAGDPMTVGAGQPLGPEA